MAALFFYTAHLLNLLLILETLTLALVVLLRLTHVSQRIASATFILFLVFAVAEARLGLMVLVKITRQQDSELAQII